MRDCENSYLSFDPQAADPHHDLLGHSITYRVAVGPRTGEKVFTLQSLPAQAEQVVGEALGKAAGFSLHAGIGMGAREREKLERLARYVSRPAISSERLSLTPQGLVHYRLKTPYRDGTTHVVLERLDFLARLAALVPPPRMNLVRYHGVFAPASGLRALITPAGRGRGRAKSESPAGAQPQKRRAMSWMQRLKRVFAIDIERCRRCGGQLKVIASIEDPALIERILGHRSGESASHSPFASRAPPQPQLL